MDGVFIFFFFFINGLYDINLIYMDIFELYRVVLQKKGIYLWDVFVSSIDRDVDRHKKKKVFFFFFFFF